MRNTTEITFELITQINTHHQNAMKQASDAVKSAEAAGKLLLEVKAALPHGEFTKWIKENLSVSDRQVQRYIAVAQGKTVPIRKLLGKTDTVSVLNDSIFVPRPGHIFIAKDVGAVDNHYLVESCSEWPNFFFVTHITNEDGPDEMTARPVEAMAVHDNLIYYGMPDPLNVEWLVKKSNGVMEAGETLYGPSDPPPKHVMPRLSPRRFKLVANGKNLD